MNRWIPAAAIAALMLIAFVSAASAETAYFADARITPGQVYASDASGSESSYYSRPGGSNLYSFTFHPYLREKLYYVNANENKIYRAVLASGTWTPEELVYTHNTYVRDLAFLDAQGNLRLYFSESSGAGGNGKIYYIDSRGTAVPFFTVNLREVDGSWAGNFAFDESGTLYLSSGNRVPAYLYRVEGGRVNRIYTSNSESISGFVVKRNVVYYANWRTEIKALDLSTMTVSSFRSQPSHKWISDVYV